MDRLRDILDTRARARAISVRDLLLLSPAPLRQQRHAAADQQPDRRRLRHESSGAASASVAELLPEVGGEIVEVQRVDDAVVVEVRLAPDLAGAAEVGGETVEVQRIDGPIE